MTDPTPTRDEAVEAVVDRVEDVVLADWFRHTSDPKASRRVVVRAVVSRMISCGGVAAVPSELRKLAENAIPYREGTTYFDSAKDRDRFIDLAVPFIECLASAPAPAEMPGVEERLRRILAEARIEPEPEASDFAVENIKALFAPILAEKDLHHATGERITRKDLNNAHRKGAEEGRLAAHLIDGVNSPLNACCYRDGCRALEARALAAEAALAAERERVDQLHATIRKAHVAMTMACALPGVASEYDFSEAIASTEATLARRAAAIRAEGSGQS